MNSNPLVCLCLFLIWLFCPCTVFPQTSQSEQQLVIDSQLRKRIIDQIGRSLQDKYIEPEKVTDINLYMQTRLKNGAYDKLDDPGELAQSLTKDLRTVSKDLHLFVTYDPALAKRILAAPQTPSYELKELPPTEESLAEMRTTNYSFQKLEIMRGNIGYLDLRSFVDATYSKDTAAAAMNFLANTDAVIIDLRRNPGGFINLELFLASYFYPDRVEWLARYHRDGNKTLSDWTLRDVPGKRMPNVDLFLLTSSETGSAAEGFAFMLQQQKRARVIGEKTSGAGYGNKETPIGDGFVFYVSVFRQFDRQSGRGWQTTGVPPDVASPAARALAVAHSEAVKTLLLKATDAKRKQQLSWLSPLLELEAYGPKQIPIPVLRRYVGKYDNGKIDVSLDQDQLSFLGASGIKRRMLALGEDLFLVEDSSVSPERQARARFVMDSDGVVTELRLLVADGRSFPRARMR